MLIFSNNRRMAQMFSLCTLPSWENLDAHLLKLWKASLRIIFIFLAPWEKSSVRFRQRHVIVINECRLPVSWPAVINPRPQKRSMCSDYFIQVSRCALRLMGKNRTLTQIKPGCFLCSDCELHFKERSWPFLDDLSRKAIHGCGNAWFRGFETLESFRNHDKVSNAERPCVV